MADIADKLAFLTSHEAMALSHSSDSLLSHLLGTHALLVDWGCREALSDAGLFHSVYGTESYPCTLAPLSARARIRALLGAEAERLAFLFGIMDKRSFYANLPGRERLVLRSRIDDEELELEPGELSDLCHLVVANWLEQRPRVDARYRFMRRRELSQMREWLSASAWAALDEVYRFADHDDEEPEP
ncbi:hypothetical protein ENSA5_08620 [Enhygromyxa salina]|uniref:DUF6817 domain-containing protein n=1 Tax=Enhygromyxa salina TaxID=215803 RepID=A0A2S9YH16_9BACT|nr:hypothetical protein [Enhygromyxa salina]PRQ04331.1 hypothetical protein ENSA5_08620 [Enhygromyxa salina]